MPSKDKREKEYSSKTVAPPANDKASYFQAAPNRKSGSMGNLFGSNQKADHIGTQLKRDSGSGHSVKNRSIAGTKLERDQRKGRYRDPGPSGGPNTSRVSLDRFSTSSKDCLEEFDIPTVSRIPTMPSIYSNPHDIQMAARQTRITSLSPTDQQKQEEWAQSKLPELGPCPAGFAWVRLKYGYQCSAGSHYISHEVIAKGQPGFYTVLMHPSVLRGFMTLSEEWIPETLELIPDNGWWWLGPLYDPCNNGSRSENGTRDSGRGIDLGRKPSGGPGGPSPTSEFLRSLGLSIKFPKGKECPPGDHYGQEDNRGYDGSRHSRNQGLTSSGYPVGRLSGGFGGPSYMSGGYAGGGYASSVFGVYCGRSR
jgi:hypothetical protein